MSDPAGSERLLCIGIVRELPAKPAAAAKPRSYSCNSCQLSFLSVYKLQLHLLESHRNEESRSCKDCGRSFLHHKALCKHVIKRVCVSKRVVSCPHCSAPFPNRSKLATHVSTVHLRAPKTILCDVCGAVFSRRGALQKHLLTFHGGGGDGPSSPRRCPLCPAAFRAVDNLQRHLVSRHANWKRWVCSLCSHRYNHSVDLKRHVVKKHAMILPAIKGSSKKDILDVHVLPGPAEAAPLPAALTERRHQLRRLLDMVPSGRYDPQLLAVFGKLPLARPGIKQAQPSSEPPNPGSITDPEPAPCDPVPSAVPSAVPAAVPSAVTAAAPAITVSVAELRDRAGADREPPARVSVELIRRDAKTFSGVREERGEMAVSGEPAVEVERDVEGVVEQEVERVERVLPVEGTVVSMKRAVIPMERVAPIESVVPMMERVVPMEQLVPVERLVPVEQVVPIEVAMERQETVETPGQVTLGPAEHTETVERPVVLSGAVLCLGGEAATIPLLLAPPPPPPPPPTVRLITPLPVTTPTRKLRRRTIGRRATGKPSSSPPARSRRLLLPAPPAPASCEQVVTLSLVDGAGAGAVTLLEAPQDGVVAAEAPLVLGTSEVASGDKSSGYTLSVFASNEAAGPVVTPTAVEEHRTAPVMLARLPASDASVASPPPSQPAIAAQDPESVPSEALSQSALWGTAMPDQVVHPGAAAVEGQGMAVEMERRSGLGVGTERMEPEPAVLVESMIRFEDGRTVGQDERSMRTVCREDGVLRTGGEGDVIVSEGDAVLPPENMLAVIPVDSQTNVPEQSQIAYSNDGVPQLLCNNRSEPVSGRQDAPLARTKPRRTAQPKTPHALRTRSGRVIRFRARESSPETNEDDSADRVQKTRTARQSRIARSPTSSDEDDPEPVDDRPLIIAEDTPPVPQAEDRVPPTDPGPVTVRHPAAPTPKRSWAAPVAWAGGRGKGLLPRVITKMDRQTAPHTLSLLECCMASRTDEDRRQSRFPCTSCSRVLSSKPNLRAHLVSHTGEAPFHCSACPATFKHFANARGHLRRHTAARCACEVCGRAFLLQADLRRHRRTHAEQRQKLSCGKCPAQYSRADNLARHVRLAHGAEPPARYRCDICGKELKTEAWLKQHKMIHKATQDQACTICGRRFTLRSYLERHMKSHNQRRVYCDLCPRRFINIKNLTVHRQSFHRNPVPLTEEERRRAAEPRPEPAPSERRPPSAPKRPRPGGRPRRLSVEIVRARQPAPPPRVERRSEERAEESSDGDVGSDEDWTPD